MLNRLKRHALIIRYLSGNILAIDPVPASERACPHGASCFPSTTYPKQHLSYEGQLDILKSRGLHVEDDGELLRALQRFGYYRLSGYW